MLQPVMIRPSVGLDGGADLEVRERRRARGRARFSRPDDVGPRRARQARRRCRLSGDRRPERRSSPVDRRCSERGDRSAPRRSPTDCGAPATDRRTAAPPRPPTPRRRAASTAGTSPGRAAGSSISPYRSRPARPPRRCARCGCRSSGADARRPEAADWCRSPSAHQRLSRPVSARNSLSFPSEIRARPRTQQIDQPRISSDSGYDAASAAR